MLDFLRNGNFQAALATIIGIVAVSIVPELGPVKEHLLEVVLVIVGALFGNGLKKRG